MNSSRKKDVPARLLDPALHVQHPVLAGMLACYRSLQQASAVPPWTAFSPARVPREALRHLLVIEVATGTSRRFRWRLVGTHVASALQRDFTGRYFDDLYAGELLARMTAAPEWVLQHRRPLRTLNTGDFADRGFLSAENLFLPFADADGAITRIVVTSVYQLPAQD